MQPLQRIDGVVAQGVKNLVKTVMDVRESGGKSISGRWSGSGSLGVR
jgi:hypothetical protein